MLDVVAILTRNTEKLISMDSLVFAGGQAGLDICLSFVFRCHHGTEERGQGRKEPTVPHGLMRRLTKLRAFRMVGRVMADTRSESFGPALEFHDHQSALVPNRRVHWTGHFCKNQICMNGIVKSCQHRKPESDSSSRCSSCEGSAVTELLDQALT